MYNSYFGFREKPFKLVPNPDYLYLSKSHQIALAHLTYAVEQGDGFVVITGEVGTGKTTLCRNFLERLDERTESAYIFNPKLDSIQLLETICNEFGIRTNHNTVKQLLDVINGYLILKNNEDRKVILLIDEAQNLSIENLEMVRMLSNLETTRSKLLQIILVGQPELGDKLDSYELRQLAQRISLSAHLTPFSLSETIGYIQHRTNIAAQLQSSLFTRSACNAIFRHTAGIPRMINIVCDRALLTAFSLDRPKVTAAIAKQAIREIASRGREPVKWFRGPNMAWGLTLACMIIVVGFLYFKSEIFGSHPRPGDATVSSAQPTTYPIVFSGPPEALPTDQQETIRAAPAASEISMPSAALDPDRIEEMPEGIATKAELEKTIALLDPRKSRFNAVTGVLAHWGQAAPHSAQLPTFVSDREFFDIAAHQYGLRVYTSQSDWDLVRHLDLPAIISLKHPSTDGVVYMALVGWEMGIMHLAGIDGKTTLRADMRTLTPYLHGPAYVYWKNTIGFDGIVSSSSPARTISAVKALLRRAGFDELDVSPEFDWQTQQSIVAFQARHRLDPDGLIGPLTKIFLIREAGSVDLPRLNADKSGGGA
jgi:general secretion pathway protein A